ncbi:MAG TPA: hypothetical protein VFV02_16435 [Acidimicrobiales bacterium]|nr:hypothetical protein [Acidimicrobiales bacterium]
MLVDDFGLNRGITPVSVPGTSDRREAEGLVEGLEAIQARQAFGDLDHHRGDRKSKPDTPSLIYRKPLAVFLNLQTMRVGAPDEVNFGTTGDSRGLAEG